MKRYDWSAAPMILGLVLGPIFENALRQSLTLSHGSGAIFVTRPISAVLLALRAHRRHRSTLDSSLPCQNLF